MLVSDWEDFLKWFDDKKYTTKLDIAIDGNDDIQFKNGKLYISREGLNSDVVVSCDSWNKLIDAVAKGAAEEEKAKREEKADKDFVNSLVDTLKKDIAVYEEVYDDDDIVRIVLSDKAYNLLIRYKNALFNSWKEKYNLKKGNLEGIDYRIFYYNESSDAVYSKTGRVETNTKEGEA